MTSKPPFVQRLMARWHLVFALCVALLTLVPYLLAQSHAEDRHYLWLGYNFDDACVYLSWMSQAAEGSLRVFNRFTTEPQNGMIANPLFIKLGGVSRFTGLPLVAVFHLARLVFGFALIVFVWKFLQTLLRDNTARVLALFCVVFSAGLGWLPLFWDGFGFDSPVDKWQPEAITFLSLYLNPLFCASLCLQVLVLHCLFQGEQTGERRYALQAGVCGLFLALIHTYDVITVSAIWTITLIAQGIANRTFPKAAVVQATLAGAITLPGVVYIGWQLQSESVFRARANVETLSPAPYYLLLGYGFTLLLALAPLVLFAKKRPLADEQESSPPVNAAAIRLLGVWLIVNLAVAYLPVPFQRKLLQGAHLPIAILAGVTLSLFLKPWRTQKPLHTVLAVISVALLSITNIRFVWRDIQNASLNLTQTQIQRPYVGAGEMEALEWCGKNAEPNAAIQPLPWLRLLENARAGRRQVSVSDMTLACLAPSVAKRAVYCGHFGETPQYDQKLKDLIAILSPKTTDEDRKATLQRMRVRYLVFSQTALSDTDAEELAPHYRGRLPLPTYLKEVHRNSDAVVFEVNL